MISKSGGWWGLSLSLSDIPTVFGYSSVHAFMSREHNAGCKIMCNDLQGSKISQYVYKYADGPAFGKAFQFVLTIMIIIFFVGR